MIRFDAKLAGNQLGIALLALCLSTFPVLGQAPSPASSDSELRVGFFADSTIEVDSTTLHNVLETWVNTVTPPGVSEVDVKILSRAEEWQQSIRAGAFNLYGLYAYQLLELEKDEELLKPVLSTLEGKSTKSTLLLVSRRADSIRAPEDLRGKRVLVNTKGLGDLPFMWLITEIATIATPEEMEGFCTMTPVDSTARALLPVYFGQVDTCVVTQAEFTKQAELNPEIFDRLDYTSFKSSPLLVSIFACHRDYDRLKAQRIGKEAEKRAKSVESARLVDLIHRSGLAAYEESDLHSLRDLYNDFNAIFPDTPEADKAIAPDKKRASADPR